MEGAEIKKVARLKRHGAAHPHLHSPEDGQPCLVLSFPRALLIAEESPRKAPFPHLHLLPSAKTRPGKATWVGGQGPVPRRSECAAHAQAHSSTHVCVTGNSTETDLESPVCSRHGRPKCRENPRPPRLSLHPKEQLYLQL